MSASDKPSLEMLAKTRDEMLAALESGEGEKMEGLTLERLRDAMFRPNALETMQEMLESGPGSAQVGAPAPDFELSYLPGYGAQGDASVALSQHFGKRPVGLIFGSYT